MKLFLAIACIILLPSCDTVRGAWLEWYRHQGRETYVEVPLYIHHW